MDVGNPVAVIFEPDAEGLRPSVTAVAVRRRAGSRLAAASSMQSAMVWLRKSR
jgi:hypothetical protein